MLQIWMKLMVLMLLMMSNLTIMTMMMILMMIRPGEGGTFCWLARRLRCGFAGPGGPKKAPDLTRRVRLCVEFNYLNSFFIFIEFIKNI